eukprot:3830379-Pyramimonas_sp.AAC.1
MKLNETAPKRNNDIHDDWRGGGGGPPHETSERGHGASRRGRKGSGVREGAMKLVSCYGIALHVDIACVA